MKGPGILLLLVIYLACNQEEVGVSDVGHNGCEFGDFPSDKRIFAGFGKFVDIKPVLQVK